MNARLAFAVFFLISIFGLLSIAPAGATGTMRVQQSNGTVQVYHDVLIRVAQRTLRIGSKDRKGVLVIDRAACTYAGAVMRCLPSTMKLEQSGQTKEIQLITGTIYVNLTDDTQQLHHSSTQLAPHDILLALQTKRGTYVSVHGHIDEVQP
jgi:hypothetical protein